MSEPITPEQLAAIRERADNRQCDSPWHETCMRIDHAALLAEVDRLRRILWQAQSLAADWHMKGEYDMKNAKTLPDDDISALVLSSGADMVEYARELRQALEARSV